MATIKMSEELFDLQFQIQQMERETDQYIAEQEKECNKLIDEVIVLKMQGQDTTHLVRKIARYKENINAAVERMDSMNDILDQQISMKHEAVLLDGLSSIASNVNTAMSQLSVNQDGAQEMRRVMFELGEQKKAMAASMAKAELAFSIATNQSTQSVADAAAHIDRVISDRVQSAKLNANMTVEELKQAIKNAI